MTEHSHVLGGSSAERRLNCPGSLALEKEAPEQLPSEFAERGTMLHAAMQLLLTADPPTLKQAEPLFRDLVGQDMGVPGQELTVDLIDTKIRPALSAWFEIVETHGIEDWFLEQRVSLETVIPGAFGTADVLAIDKERRFHTLDWKFGDGVVVEVNANDALAFYTGAAFYDEDAELVEFCRNIKEVFFHIVQPRGEEMSYATWKTSERWIEQWIDQMTASMEKALRPQAPIKPGDWCKWCRARPMCPAYQELSSAALSKNPQGMTPVDLAHALEQAHLLEGWIKAVQQFAQEQMESGAAIPGYKLVEKRPKRLWLDAAAAEKRLKAAKMKVGDMYQRTLISPTQLEQKNKKLYSRIAEGYVSLRSSGLTIAPDSDKRAAVVSSMALLANALPEQAQAQETGT